MAEAGSRPSLTESVYCDRGRPQRAIFWPVLAEVGPISTDICSERGLAERQLHAKRRAVLRGPRRAEPFGRWTRGIVASRAAPVPARLLVLDISAPPAPGASRPLCGLLRGCRRRDHIRRARREAGGAGGHRERRARAAACVGAGPGRRRARARACALGHPDLSGQARRRDATPGLSRVTVRRDKGRKARGG